MEIPKYIICVILSWICIITQVSAGTKCTLNNGRCTYRVQLVDTCENTIPASLGEIGSDDDSRMVELEQKFSDSQTHYSKKISALEAKLTELTELILPNDDSSRYWGSTSFGRTDFDITESNARRPENGLLTEVHKTFTDLRAELDAAKRRLAELEGRVYDSGDELATAKAEIKEAMEKLGLSEDRLLRVENEKQNLQAYIADKDAEKEDASRRADSCTEEMREQNEELYRLREENNRLRVELARCHTTHQSVQRSRDLLVSEHHVLRTKHHNMTDKYNRTASELKECNDRAVMAVRTHERIMAAARNDVRRTEVKTASYCGFEDPNLCGYVNEAFYDDLDWRQWSGATPSANTGPSHDHTCENKRGQYVYAMSSNAPRDMQARLISPNHRGSGQQCIEFYYFMFGGNVGILNVYFKVDDWDEKNLPPPIWRAFGNQGNMWTMAQLAAPLDVVREGYQVVFEARTGGGYEGDIALDDVRIYDGPCQGSTQLQDRWNRWP